jgi:hypothetical protein
MAEQQGGYRQPANPAPVSGPGALAQRTDGGAQEGMQPPAQTQAPMYMPGLGYGKGGQNMANEQAAPLAGNPVPEMPPLTGVFAPTAQPNLPTTTGVDIGAGAGSEVMPPMPNIQVPASVVMRKIAQRDMSGDAELLFQRLRDNGH